MLKILVVGGTKYFGVHLVNALIKQGNDVTIATRGKQKDGFGDSVSRINLDRADNQSVQKALAGKFFDVVYDNIAYSSNEVKYLLDNVRCNKCIQTSSASVYDMKLDIVEEDFNPLEKELVWCTRDDFSYDEIKRQAECALFQHYKNVSGTTVRPPYVIGKDDYTNRLLFYIEHVVNKKPMFIDNIDTQLGFVDSREAGEFLAFLVDTDYLKPLNVSSSGTISVGEILEYITLKTGIKPVLSSDGEHAPYNSSPEFSLNTSKAQALGFKFSNLREWIYPLIDHYIEISNKN